MYRHAVANMGGEPAGETAEKKRMRTPTQAAKKEIAYAFEELPHAKMNTKIDKLSLTYFNKQAHN